MSETDSHSDGTDYEQYELTESEVKRILVGEVIEKDGQEFGIGIPLNSVGFIYENKWNNLLCREDVETIRWSGESGGDSIQIEIVEDEDGEVLSDEELTESIAENTDLTTEEIEEGVKDIQIEPPEQAVVEDTDTDYTNTDLHSIDDDDKQHVTMECTMDISDLDAEDKEVICQLARQFEDSFETIVQKNRDYGFSFLTSGKKLTESAGSPFNSPMRSQAFGLLTRTGDKRERLINNVYGNGSAAVSDEPHVTAKEASNYYQFLALVLENPNLAESVVDS